MNIIAPKISNPKLIPEVNIGTVGHVDHGKSTLVETLTGKWPSVHSEELKRGITIKLGYADATIYKCKKCNRMSVADRCGKCFEVCEPARTVSFVDSPGHETLMATVLAGASLMDGVIFTIAANEKCPQPQTKEHMMVLDIIGIKNIIIVQTKIDLVTKEKAMENYKEIKEFVKGTVAEDAPIIPVASQKKINIDSLLEAIQKVIPTPERKKTKSSRMLIVRSFDVNRPGTDPLKLHGGILGGSLTAGEFSVGEEIEIRPGYKKKDKWISIKTKITGLQKAGSNLDMAGPGGLLGVMTELDPFLTKADSLSGSIAGKDLPEVRYKLTMKIKQLDRYTQSGTESIREGDMLLISVGTARTVGVVKKSKDKIDVDLKAPVCCEKDDRIVISKRIGEKWKLIGYGNLV